VSTRVARVVRGLVVAIVALLVASLAHTAGGGQIGAVGFAIAFAFSMLVSIALAGRSVSRVRVAIAVSFSQGVFHLLFGVGAGDHFADAGHPASMGMAVMNPIPAAARVVAAVPVSTPPTPMPDSGWMWAAHALAAIVTIVTLVKAERAFWTLAEWVSYSLVRVFTLSQPVAVATTATAHAVRDVRPLDTRFLIAGVSHRGPPRPVASI
jgi:hypothetical protein